MVPVLLKTTGSFLVFDSMNAPVLAGSEIFTAYETQVFDGNKNQLFMEYKL